MVTIAEAEVMLNEACEALPREIFRELNGGVNLLPDVKKDEDGNYILGMYYHNTMGRYVEIFYGSILEACGDLPPAEFRERLDRTLRHELTHHIESLAGDRSLERWDEVQKALMGYVEIEAESVLFVDDNDAALAPAACAMFTALAKAQGLQIRCDSAGLQQGTAVQPEAANAAAEHGVDIAAHVPQKVSLELLKDYDAVLCMSMPQAETLADFFPEQEHKFMCLSDTDIYPPRLKLGWGSVMKRLSAEAGLLLDDLTAGG